MHDLDPNYLWYAHYQHSSSQFYPYHTPVTSTEFIKSDFSSGWVLIPVGQSNEHLYNPHPLPCLVLFCIKSSLKKIIIIQIIHLQLVWEKRHS